MEEREYEQLLKKIIHGGQTDGGKTQADSPDVLSARHLTQMLAYAEALAQGRLAQLEEIRHNPLCNDLVQLHAQLKGLLKRMDGIAGGEGVCALPEWGEVSQAFERMACAVEAQRRQAEEQAALAREYNDLLAQMMGCRDEHVVILCQTTGEILYCNRTDEGEDAFLLPCEALQAWTEQEQGKRWECTGEKGNFYRITSFNTQWRGRKSCVHMIADITEEKKHAIHLNQKAYRDPGTGLYNRLFFEEYMTRTLRSGERAALCYLDIDGLKAVNDRWGHNEGDAYIRRFTATVQRLFRSDDVFARVGGDEFCLVLHDCSATVAEMKLEQARESFAQSEEIHSPGFSYGVIEINADMTLEEAIRKADIKMYECKRKNKEKYGWVRTATDGI